MRLRDECVSPDTLGGIALSSAMPNGRDMPLGDTFTAIMAWLDVYRNVFLSMEGRGELVGFIDWFRAAATFSEQRGTDSYPPAIAKAVKRIRPQPRACFPNCQQVALKVQRAIYVEGLADCGAGIPLLHAWLSYRGEIIDPTWDLLRDELPKKQRYYFGVRIGRKSIRQSVLTAKTWRPLLWFSYKKSQGIEDVRNFPPIG